MFCLNSRFSDRTSFRSDVENEVSCGKLTRLCCLNHLCFRISSKLQSDVLREAIASLLTESKEKPKKFTQTIELQIGLKNYDPQKDKRFSGSVRLPHIPRPKYRVCVLGDASHKEEVRHYNWRISVTFLIRFRLFCRRLRNLVLMPLEWII